MTSRCILTAAISIAICVAAYGGSDPQKEPVSDFARRDALIKALDEGNMRAIDELGYLSATDPLAEDALLKRLPASGSVFETVQLARALARSPRLTGAKVIAALTQSGTHPDLDSMLIVLCELGRRAGDASQYLSDQLTRHDTGQETRGKIGAALVNTGQDRSANMKALTAAVSSRNNVGRGAVGLMNYVWAGDWADKGFADALCAWFTTEVDAAASAREKPPGRFSDYISNEASVLGGIGEMARSAVPSLERAIVLAEKGKLPANLIISCGVALANIDRAAETVHLRRVAKYVGGPLFGDHTDSTVLMLTANRVDSGMVAVLSGMLSDADPEVVAGAAFMLASKGLAAEKAVPALIAVVKSSAADVARCAAAGALGLTAPVSLLPDLKVLEAHAEPPAVQDMVTQSIAVIELRDE